MINPKELRMGNLILPQHELDGKYHRVKQNISFGLIFIRNPPFPFAIPCIFIKNTSTWAYLILETNKLKNYRQR